MEKWIEFRPALVIAERQNLPPCRLELRAPGHHL